MYKVVKLNKADLNRAKRFADLRCSEDQSLYKSRGGFKPSDIINGALAEIAAYKLLKEYGFEVNKPDFKIYDKKKKSFDADLCTEYYSFHVKGQSLESTRRYGSSWLMQRSDPIIKDPKQGHFIIPCTVDADGLEVKIHGIFSVKTLIRRECFDDCCLEYLNRTKMALYLDYIESTMSMNARWSLLYRE